MPVFKRQEWKACLVALVLVVAGATSCGRNKTRTKSMRGSADAAAALAAQEARALKPRPAPLPEQPLESPPKTGAYGGSLHVHLESEPPHLNPLQDGYQVIQRVVMGLVYETLLECGPTGYATGLAESWETSPDGLRLSLKLRDGVRWHDGHPLTSVDVQASIEPLLRSTTHQPTLRALLGDIEAVEVMPDRVVRLRLLRPSQLILRALCEVPILPADLIRGTAAQVANLARQPIGTGPFRFAAWERGKRIRLLRAHPAEAKSATPTPPFVDEIVFDIETDGARALARTRRGEIDILPRVLDVHYPDQVAPGSLRETLQLYRLSPDRYSFLAVNHRRPLLANVDVRQALARLWHRERWAEEVHRGLVVPIGGPTFARVPPPPFDPPGAIRLLESAQLRDTNGDGVRDKEGAPVRVTLLQPASARKAAVENRAFALELRRAGILLDVVTVDAATFLARLKQGDFDLAPVIWEGRRDDDPRALFGPQGELAFMGYHSSSLEALLDELRVADGPAARTPILQRIGDNLAADQAVIFLYRHDVPAIVARRVHGLSGWGDRLDLRAVWLDP